MVRAIVDSAIRVEEATLPAKSLAILHRALSFPNPDYVRRERLGKWTGDVPEEICLIERDSEGWLVLPRGAVGQLRAAVQAAGKELRFDDKRIVHEPIRYRFELALRDYQEDAVRALSRHIQGIAILPCGAGKTVIGAGAIARCQQPALVLVHTRDLLEQWRETLRSSLMVEPGIFAEGKTQADIVTVATIQMLSSLPEGALESFGARFGIVIVDECHHVPATTFRDVIGKLGARYRFGLTATPERSDGLTPLLSLAMGNTVFRIGHERLIEAGHLVVPEVVVIPTGVRAPADNHAELVSRLVAHAGRNAQLAELAASCAREDRTTLILSARVDHCRVLAGKLEELGIAASALTGKTANAERIAVLDAFRSGELHVVCATALADEGLDVARLERLILATPARAEGRTIQRLGRLMRPHPGKATPILYDFVDDHPMAERQHRARLRAYRKVLGRGVRVSVVSRSAA